MQKLVILRNGYHTIVKQQGQALRKQTSKNIFTRNSEHFSLKQKCICNQNDSISVQNETCSWSSLNLSISHPIPFLGSSRELLLTFQFLRRETIFNPDKKLLVFQLRTPTQIVSVDVFGSFKSQRITKGGNAIHIHGANLSCKLRSLIGISLKRPPPCCCC